MSERPALEALIPHRGAMRWLDAAELDGRGRIRAVAGIRHDNPLLHEGQLPGLALVELLAQAGAARAGIEARRRGGMGGPGYLIAVRELELGPGASRVGDELEVDAELEVLRADERGEYSELRGEVRLGAARLARGAIGLLRAPAADRVPCGADAEPRRGASGLSLAGLEVEGEAPRYRVLVPREGPLLDGHFPGRPVLPAAAQLVAVAAAAGRAGWLEPAARGLERAKFARPVLAGAELALDLTREPGAVRFALRADEVIVSSGRISLGPLRARPAGGE